MILADEVENQFSGHYKGFLVSQTNLLMSLDGIDGGHEAREADHGSQYCGDGPGLYNLRYRVTTSIDLDVGQISEAGLQLVVVALIGDDHGGRMKLSRLLNQFVNTIVGRQRIDFIAVGVLTNDVKRLCTDGARTAKNTYLLLH